MRARIADPVLDSSRQISTDISAILIHLQSIGNCSCPSQVLNVLNRVAERMNRAKQLIEDCKSNSVTSSHAVCEKNCRGIGSNTELLAQAKSDLRRSSEGGIIVLQ